MTLYIYRYSRYAGESPTDITRNDFIRSLTPGCRAGDKERIRDSYRGHQVMNIFANQLFSTYVAFSICIGACVVITCSFCLIRFTSTLPTFFILWVFNVAVGLTGILVYNITNAIYIRLLSQMALNSFQIVDLNRSREQYRFWKSCRPLEIRIGPLGSIETHEFLLILFADIILNNIVALLLSTR